MRPVVQFVLLVEGLKLFGAPHTSVYALFSVSRVTR
jgi:hypothetical protein